jgi:hypothetical protein
VLKAGVTVEMRLGHPTIPHLWILITDPRPESQKSVIVSVTTLRSHSDQTVILRKGDHPYILHDSVISYQDAQEFSVIKIQSQIDRGWPQCHSCSEELLKRCRQASWRRRLPRSRSRQYAGKLGMRKTKT